QTVLHTAASENNIELCRLFLQHGASASTADNEGELPLHIAIVRGNLDLARLFLEYPDGSDGAASRSRARDSSGQTALHLAVNSQRVKMCSLLLEHGALVDDADAEGKTP
ncbi:ankyrin, partial [Peniophora sp. CONT]